MVVSYPLIGGRTVDADRNLAMKAAALRLATSVIDRAVSAGETGQFIIAVSLHRGQINKAAGFKQAELTSVLDGGDGRLVEKVR